MFQFIMRASCLLSLLLALLAKADTYPRQTSIDAQHYVFRLTLSDDTDEIVGEASVTVRLLRPDVKQLSLDLASNMAVTSVDAPFAHNADRLNITLPAAPGDLRTVTIKYHGVPAGGLRIGTNRYHDRTFNTDNWPNQARQWLPTIDHPYDKATSEFIITAPSKYLVVANGLLVEETELGDGRKLTHWKQSVPIASWLNAIAVAPYSSRHFGTAAGVPLETWVYHQDRDKGITTFDKPTRDAMEFFSSAIGPYSYEKLADVEIPGLQGGAEHATAIFYGEDAVTDRPATNLVAHEIAHHWFGNSVTEKDWDDVWLSEGFATYFTLLNTEHYEGRDAFVAGLNKSRDAIFKLPPVAIIHDNLSDMKKVTNRVIYEKGAWTLHMLRAQLGDDKFWATIREYYRRYQNANASTDDFRNVAEEISGMQLSWFFQEWLKRAGTPVIAGSWHYDAQARAVQIDLEQTQPGELYRLPLEVLCAGKITKVELLQRKQHFTIPADQDPKDLTLDPNTQMLMTAEFHPAPQ